LTELLRLDGFALTENAAGKLPVSVPAALDELALVGANGTGCHRLSGVTTTT